VYASDFELFVLDGCTGQIKRSVKTPLDRDYPVGDKYPFERVNVDSIRICNFSGKRAATDILIKDRYSRIWVYDNALNLLWYYTGSNTGHYPYTKDINGDGREEMLAGYDLVNADGVKQWTLPIPTDHTDEIIIAKLNPEDTEERVYIVCGDEGFVISDLQGNILKKDMIGHGQRISAGNYIPGKPGYEIAVSTYWGNQGIIYIYDCAGNLVHSFEPGTDGNLLSPVNWTGDGSALILLNGNAAAGGMIDGYGRRVVVFPDDSHPDLCAETVDFTGDCRDEIVLWDEKRMWIYTQDNLIADAVRLHKYPEYNASNYRGEYALM
jgi:hypothetical protein